MPPDVSKLVGEIMGTFALITTEANQTRLYQLIEGLIDPTTLETTTLQSLYVLDPQVHIGEHLFYRCQKLERSSTQNNFLYLITLVEIAFYLNEW
jgi:hypothetical protein